MKLLLDTHTYIWWLQDAPGISSKARKALVDERNSVSVSAASIYEIELKIVLGKLEGFPLSPREAIAELGFLELPIRTDHSERAARLPIRHRDPWDRVLAAQAIIEDMTVVTRDPEIAALGALTLW